MSEPEPEPGGARSRWPRRQRSRRYVNPEGRMPLIEHLRELRDRVFKAALIIAVGSVVGWLLYDHVMAFLEAPYCRLHLSTPLAHGTCWLYVTGVFDAFFLKLKVSIFTGLIISGPLWLYQLWAFIAPGLHSRERRWAYLFGASAVPLFALGGTFAYYALTRGLHFLLGQVPGNVAPIITINTYLGYAVAMLTIFGIAFEVPLVLVLLNLAGVLTHERFAKWRRVIIFLVFAFAAVATPSPDPLSMLLLAVPCVVLVELAEIFVWANDRRRARTGPVFPGLTPEQVHEYGLDRPLPELGEPGQLTGDQAGSVSP